MADDNFGGMTSKGNVARQGATRAGSAFWMAAVPLSRTNTALGAFQRRLAARIGKSKALIATARMIAILYYKTLQYGMSFQDQSASSYQQATRERQLQGHQRRTKAMGYQLVATSRVLQIPCPRLCFLGS
jgi:transposase